MVLFPGPTEAAEATEDFPGVGVDEAEEEDDGICRTDLRAPSTLTLAGGAEMFRGSYRDFLPGLSAGAAVEGLFLSWDDMLARKNVEDRGEFNQVKICVPRGTRKWSEQEH